MVLTLKVEPSDQVPLHGSLSVDGGDELVFSGWLQLLGLLHQTLTPLPSETPPAAWGSR